MKFQTMGMLTAITALLAACDAPEQKEKSPETETVEVAAKPVIEPWGYPLNALDKSTRPQDDLYQFANGGWLASTEIPGDRSGVGFSQIMRDRNDERIKSIIADFQSAEVAAGSDGQKIRDLYAAYMDIAAINAAGMKPLLPLLGEIEAATNHDDIARAMMAPALGARSLFGIFVGIDSKDPNNYTVSASHAGTALPDKSYYERDSERLTALRASYVDYMEKVFTRLGDADPRAKAEAVFNLEKAIASNHWSRAERRNADRTYNPFTIDELAAYAPGFPWQVAVDSYGVGNTNKIVVREKEAFPPMAELFAATTVDLWKDYLRFHLVASNAQYLSDEIADERFAFFGTVLRGQKAQRPRDERAIAFVNNFLNQAVGKIYIERFFPEESKALVREMFENIRLELGERIDNLTWMTDDTKAAARTKLAKMNAKIAYPEVWRDYSAWTVSPANLFGDIQAYRQFDHEQDIARLGKTVDKREWFSGPQTVNAFYSPSRNEAFIPAGYIQSPLFDPNADPALNYGALGSIIGHEIGHGFDDQGSKYDGDGVLQAWWSEEDRAAFNTLGDGFAEQFSQYEPIEGLHVNGRQTLGENIGDLAGMIVAYHAWERSLDGKDPAVLDGFTGPQRFFMGRAQGRRYKRTEESLRQRLLSAPHSPMYLRVNGMARNMDEFHEAFGVKPGDKMWLAPEDRVKIW
ncbi:M13 family metallopeptidase [Kordiimonas laminariae]|uniref:M13 family metallopeptidase n=1 Tax=Kordiimonas laminariae TaxID=2917717 RepID=UPI001FF52E41|nr:M13 family metallopeptidase [Kordiimonas laminariae]MCK0068586.1 M13 family metallopeptidase [Kordiimonas laminariae]